MTIIAALTQLQIAGTTSVKFTVDGETYSITDLILKLSDTTRTPDIGQTEFRNDWIVDQSGIEQLSGAGYASGNRLDALT